jgi:predicted DNA-binding protein
MKKLEDGKSLSFATNAQKSYLTRQTIRRISVIRQKELTPEQYKAIEQFSDGLKECFSAKRNEKTKDSVVREIIEMNMNYVISIIDLHLSLAMIDLERTAVQMQKKVLDKT